jgi:hypothetical protein
LKEDTEVVDLVVKEVVLAIGGGGVLRVFGRDSGREGDKRKLARGSKRTVL